MSYKNHGKQHAKPHQYDTRYIAFRRKSLNYQFSSYNNNNNFTYCV